MSEVSRFTCHTPSVTSVYSRHPRDYAPRCNYLINSRLEMPHLSRIEQVTMSPYTQHYGPDPLDIYEV